MVERQHAKARAGAAKTSRLSAVLLFALAGLTGVQLLVAVASTGEVRLRHGIGVLLVVAFALLGGWFWRRRRPDRAL